MTKHAAVKRFESGEISARDALQLLGGAIAEAKRTGRSTKALEAAVSQVLGMNEEPEKEDLAGASAWESSRGSAE